MDQFEKIRQLEKIVELERNERLEEKKRRLENEDRISVFEEERKRNEDRIAVFEEERKRHEDRIAVFEEERKRKDDRISLLESKICRMEFKHDLKSHTFADVYKKYLGKASHTDGDDLGLPDLNPVDLAESWQSVVTQRHILGDGTDEKLQVHPFIKLVLQVILKTFYCDKINFHYETKLKNPLLQPDFSITAKQIVVPSWQDCLSFIECKSVNVTISEGGGQAISYMMHSIFQDDDSQNNEFAFSAQTNGRSIQFFVRRRGVDGYFDLRQYCYTSVLEFINDEDASSNVSQGFKLLCRLLKLLSNSDVPLDRVKINGVPYTVIKTIQKGGSIIIGVINLDDEGPCVAKCAISHDKPGMFLIRKEAQMYKILKNSPVRTLKLSSQSNSKHLVFRDICDDDLRSWTHRLLYVDESCENSNNFERIIHCFVEIFDQIKALHNFGYTHSDVRPANILILEDDVPCLIDFVTATEHGQTLDWIQGTLIYMPEAVLTSETPYKYKRRYDLESFCYSMLDCADRHFFNALLKLSVNDDSFDKMAESMSPERALASLRREQLENLRIDADPDHFPDSRFVDLFFKFLDKLAEVSNDLEEQNYIELRQVLSSFSENSQ